MGTLTGVKCSRLKCPSAQPGRKPDAPSDVLPETCPPPSRLTTMPLFRPLQVFHEQGILFGYRHPQSSATACILSLFQMTNETLNIWTHLLPFWYLAAPLTAVLFGSPGTQDLFKTQRGLGGLRCCPEILGTPAVCGCGAEGSVRSWIVVGFVGLLVAPQSSLPPCFWA